MTHDYPDGNVEFPDSGSRVSRRIADELRWTRISRKLSVGDVAHALKIRTAYIEAMEDDRFGDLPAPVYISGFLRTYANHLGLDGEQLVTWLKDDNRLAFEPREMELPVPISDIRRPTRPIILASLTVAIGIAVAWYAYQESRSIDIDLIPEVPELISDQLRPEDVTETAPASQQTAEAVDETAAASAEPLPEAAEAAAVSQDGVQQAGETQDPLQEEQVVAETADQQQAGQTVVRTAVLQQEVQATEVTAVLQPEEQTAVDAAVPLEAQEQDALNATVAQEQAIEEVAVHGEEEDGDARAATDAAVLENANARIEPSVYGEPGAGSRVELRAVEETWIQVEVPGGTVILTHILLPGDVYHVPDRDDLTLDTGNAGGLEIRVDGALIPVLGGAGAVVRDILLAADSLKAR